MKSTFDNNQDTPHPSLNEPQSRSLKNVLIEMEHLVERSRALRRKVSRSDEEGALIHSHTDLSGKQLHELEIFEDKTQKKLMMLRDTFELKPVDEDLVRQLASSFSILWADLEDERPQRMRGYGKYESPAEAVLEPAIQELVELCLGFVAVLEKEKS